MQRVRQLWLKRSSLKVSRSSRTCSRKPRPKTFACLRRPLMYRLQPWQIRNYTCPAEVQQMIWTRRGFVRSLCRTALVLSFEDVLKLAWPLHAQAPATQTPTIGSRPTYDAKPRSAPKAASPVTGTPLGFSLMDVAKSSGLNAKTIYGGEHKNRYLLETTGCGVAFYDFDHDDWIDLFLV